jgi:hypothetical protein
VIFCAGRFYGVEEDIYEANASHLIGRTRAGVLARWTGVSHKSLPQLSLNSEVRHNLFLICSPTSDGQKWSAAPA